MLKKVGIIMNQTTLLSHQTWVKEELQRCIDFWMKFGIDKKHGGVYTCLDKKGEIYSTDKSVWMQGRCAWTFAYLCKEYGIKEEWLEISRNCLEFMEKYCINSQAGTRMYFTVTEDGKPLRQRRYCFSEGFYAIANAEFYGVTGELVHLERAKRAYELIYQLNHGLIADPTGLGPKTEAETRQGRALADPMIYLNITSVMRRIDPENQELYNKRAEECTNDIINYHLKEDMACTLESVALDGSPQLNFTAGRTLNPGHAIECAWFIMEQANYTKDTKLYEKAEKMFQYAIDAGWDQEYGGILYFSDCLGKPCEAYEHDMKIWWPHNEAMIASLMAYRDTKNPEYFHWFEKNVAYCKTYFSDTEHGEWYGYLRRDGKPTMPSTKGSTFKGPFHLPRMLIMVDKMIDELV